MDVHLERLAAEQFDLVAGWQLRAAGWTRARVEQRVLDHGWRVVHPGVYLLTRAPISRHQRWMAATLTAPDTALALASAGACWGFRPYDGWSEIVLRPGSGGPRQFGNVLVFRSKTLAGEITRRDGIPLTSPERTLIDLAPRLGARALGKAVRETIRLKTTDSLRLLVALDDHRGRRGTRRLAGLVESYARVPIGRTKSDAEALGLVVLGDAGISIPKVNEQFAGEEADLCWPDRMLIIEIDGPQFHLFASEDARKQAVWERAGFVVRRIPSGDVFDAPERLVALAR